MIELDDGSTAEGHVILLAVGRDFPVARARAWSTTASRSRGPDAYPRDGALRLADGLWVAGDPAGPELHTHQGHYQGELAVRMALGEDVEPDYRALPRATYMDPEAASVGVTLDQAREAGLDAFECVADFPTSAQGYSVEADTGHVTIVVDRATRELVGAAMACPDASAAIHECVLAIRARVKVDVLAETIHAFPSHVADLQRAVRGGAGRRSTRRRRPERAAADPARHAAPAATSPSTGPAAAARATGPRRPRPARRTPRPAARRGPRAARAPAARGPSRRR